ncbi:MAG: hypothetical protein J6X60_07725, partial [Ruminiclostridium sp.]|nr:hypothetical protein [Ruminiclostridium sp.]
AERNYDKSEKAALFIAVSGFEFISAIEKVWDELDENELKDIDRVVELIKENLKHRKPKKS